MAYKQVEEIAEIFDLVDRISSMERSIQSSPVLGSNPTQKFYFPGACHDGQRVYALGNLQSSVSTYFTKKLEIAIKEGADFTKN